MLQRFRFMLQRFRFMLQRFRFMLQRFESFVPKNIEKRKEDYKKIKEKETKELNDLAMKLSEIVKGFKDLKVSKFKDLEDDSEQFFIYKFIDCQIKTDYEEYSNIIFFFDQKDNYLAEYNSKNQDFYISYDQIMSILESKYDLNYRQIKPLIEAWVEEHFKLRIVMFEDRLKPVTVEEHFKLRPTITSNI